MLPTALLTVVVGGCALIGYEPLRRDNATGPEYVDDSEETIGDAAAAAAKEDAGQNGTESITGPRDGSILDGGRADLRPMDAHVGTRGDAGPLEFDASPEVRDGGVDAGVDGGNASFPTLDSGVLDGGRTGPCADLPQALFCEDFEDPSFAGRWSYSIVMNGSLNRDTNTKRTGAASLRATTEAFGPEKQARWGAAVFGGQSSGDVWLRAYYYVPSTTVVTTHFSTAVMSEIQEPYEGFSVAVFPTSVNLASGNNFVTGGMSFPRDRWVCIELHVAIDPTAGSVEAYLDGELATSWRDIDTLPAGGFTAAEVGIHYAEDSQGAVEVFVDDVAFGTARMPCD